MKYVNVPMTGLTPPTDAEITKILALLGDKQTDPYSYTAAAAPTVREP